MNSKNAVDKLIDFVNEDTETLDSSGKSIKRFKTNLSTLLERAENIQRKGWKFRARAQLDELKQIADERFKSFAKSFGGEDGLYEAFRSGKLNINQLGGASVHFRNREVDDLSKEELMKILKDQKLLEVKKRIEREE